MKIATVTTMLAALLFAPATAAAEPATQAGYVKSVHRTLAECEKAGRRYSTNEEYWYCYWDSPFWALWVLK